MDIGNNLAQGLVFQAALWILLLAILWDVCFRGRFAITNLALFSVFLGFSGPRYHHSPNPLGAGNLLLVGGLILLAHFRLRGGLSRYITGLIMLGLVPLIQFVGVMLIAGVVAGLIIGHIVLRPSRPLQKIVLAGIVPGFVAGVGYWLSIGSSHAVASYVRSSLELARGYDLAMAVPGNSLELLAGFLALGFLAISVALLAKSDRQTALFFCLLFAVTLVVNMKHAFVRQDTHVVYFFTFVSLVMGVVALATDLDKDGAKTLTTISLA
jgi:hypothetical protein